MDCPRCKLALRPFAYEGEAVDMCTECWGYWLDAKAFDAIARKRELLFDEEERELIETTAGRTRAAAPDAPLDCPRCSAVMKKITFNVDAMLVVDRCASHGIWLDLGELKQAQVIAERGDIVRDLFLKKLTGNA